MSRIRHDHKVKVLVLGQSSVGKTFIVSWLLDAIVRSQIHHFQVAWNRKITLSVCDFETSQSIFPWTTILAGTGSAPQPTLRRRYSAESEARSSCSISPPKCLSWKFRRGWPLLGKTCHVGLPIVLVRNKKDDLDRWVDARSVKNFVSKEDLFYIEASAKSQENIDEIFSILVDLMIGRENE